MTLSWQSAVDFTFMTVIHGKGRRRHSLALPLVISVSSMAKMNRVKKSHVRPSKPMSPGWKTRAGQMPPSTVIYQCGSRCP